MSDVLQHKSKTFTYMSANGFEVQLVPFDVDILESAKQVGTWNLSGGLVIKAPYMLDGGGMHYKKFLIETVEKTGNPVYKRAFEWCAGFGVLGFECLGTKLCEHIVFSDYHPDAIKFCLENAKSNDVENCVTGYVTPTISDIPESEKWDLVVSNPPHSPEFEETVNHIISEGQSIEAALNAARLIVDAKWSIHREFMQNIKPHLTTGADIYLIENEKHEFLIDLATEAGLTYVDTYSYPYAHINSAHHVIMHFKNI